MLRFVVCGLIIGAVCNVSHAVSHKQMTKQMANKVDMLTTLVQNMMIELNQLTNLAKSNDVATDAIKSEISILKSDIASLKTDSVATGALLTNLAQTHSVATMAIKSDTYSLKADIAVLGVHTHVTRTFLTNIQALLTETKSCACERKRMRSAIYHLASPLGRYKLTFGGARALCASRGHRVATKAQMYQALKLGLQECACGWLADGKAYFPMQINYHECGGSDRTGPFITSCGFKTNDVYCAP